MRGRSGQPQQPLELSPVEADHGISIDDGYGGCAKAELDQLLAGSRIRANVLAGIGDTLPRKKLFLLLAAPSPGLGIQNHFFFFRHGHILCLRRFLCPSFRWLGILLR